MGAPKIGTAYEDKATDNMFETYNKERASYFVLEHKGKIVGKGIIHIFVPEFIKQLYSMKALNTQRFSKKLKAKPSFFC